MQNVYEQVSHNKTRSNLIIFFFIIFIIGAAYLITYALGLDNTLIIAASFFSLIFTGANYFWGDSIVAALNNAHPAKREEYFDFYTVVENISIAAGIPTPRPYVVDSPALNAFAAGRDPKHAIVCATTGLLKRLNRTELEGVIAHEISHIQNYDVRLMTIVSLLIGSLSLLINMSYRSNFGRRRDRNDNNGILAIIGILLIFLAPIIAQLIQLALSRRREYLADASGVKLTRQPSGLISALKKLAADRYPLETASSATAPLYIKNPFKGNKLLSLFSTHPPIEDRIQALEQML